MPIRKASSGALARTVAVAIIAKDGGDVADHGIRLDHRNPHLVAVGIDEHVGGAGQDDVGGITDVALVEQDLALTVFFAVGGEGQKLELRRRHPTSSGVRRSLPTSSMSGALAPTTSSHTPAQTKGGGPS